MKYLVVLVWLFVWLSFLLSCEKRKIVYVDAEQKQKLEYMEEISKQFQEATDGRIDYRSQDVKVTLMVIDSCEYIVWEGSHFEIGFSHRARCKYCKLRNK